MKTKTELGRPRHITPGKPHTTVGQNAKSLSGRMVLEQQTSDKVVMQMYISLVVRHVVLQENQSWHKRWGSDYWYRLTSTNFRL